MCFRLTNMWCVIYWVSPQASTYKCLVTFTDLITLWFWALVSRMKCIISTETLIPTRRLCLRKETDNELNIQESIDLLVLSNVLLGFSFSLFWKWEQLDLIQWLHKNYGILIKCWIWEIYFCVILCPIFM